MLRLLLLTVLAAPTTFAQTSPESGLKRPGVALALSAGATLGGFALGLAGPYDARTRATGVAAGMLLVLGPGAGHVYAGDVGGAALGAALRGGSLFLASGVVAQALDRNGSRLSGPLFATGVGVFMMSLVYDVASAPDAARRYNRRHAVRMTLAPVMGPQVGVRLIVTR